MSLLLSYKKINITEVLFHKEILFTASSKMVGSDECIQNGKAQGMLVCVSVKDHTFPFSLHAS